MKKVASGAVMLSVLCLVVLVYGLTTTRLAVTAQPVQIVSAADAPEEFERLHRAVSNRSLVGTIFAQTLEGQASDYQLVVYTLDVKNNGLVAAEMVEVALAPDAMDVLYYTDGSPLGSIPAVNIAPGESRGVRCVLLTRSTPRGNTVRDIYITYYLWGNPFSVRVTYA